LSDQAKICVECFWRDVARAGNHRRAPRDLPGTIGGILDRTRPVPRLKNRQPPLGEDAYKSALRNTRADAARDASIRVCCIAANLRARATRGRGEDARGAAGQRTLKDLPTTGTCGAFSERERQRFRPDESRAGDVQGSRAHLSGRRCTTRFGFEFSRSRWRTARRGESGAGLADRVEANKVLAHGRRTAIWTSIGGARRIRCTSAIRCSASAGCCQKFARTGNV